MLNSNSKEFYLPEEQKGSNEVAKPLGMHTKLELLIRKAKF